jgi:hypothetical protein
VRRHPAITVLVLFLIVGIPIALTYRPRTDPDAPPVIPPPDPAKPRRDLKENLAKGIPFKMDAKAVSGSWKQVLGRATALALNPDKETLSIETSDTVIWELTDDPMKDKYEGAAKVRIDQDRDQARRQIGICLGFTEQVQKNGDRCGTCCTLCLVLDARKGNQDGKISGRIELTAWLYRDQPNFVYAGSGLLQAQDIIIVKDQRSTEWYYLAVRVDKEHLTASAKDAKDIELCRWQVPLKTISDMSAKRQKTHQLLKANKWNYTLATDFAPRGSFGIYVRDGRVSFGDLTLRTLD